MQRAVLWVRSNASTSGGVDLIGRIEIWLFEMDDQAGVGRMYADESSKVLETAEAGLATLIQRLLYVKVARIVVSTVE